MNSTRIAHDTALGITRQQKWVLLIDSHESYFYLVPREGRKPEQVQEQLEVETPHPSISKVTVEKKRGVSTEKQVLKIFCKDSESVEKPSRAATKSITGGL